MQRFENCKFHPCSSIMWYAIETSKNFEVSGNNTWNHMIVLCMMKYMIVDQCAPKMIPKDSKREKTPRKCRTTMLLGESSIDYLLSLYFSSAKSLSLAFSWKSHWHVSQSKFLFFYLLLCFFTRFAFRYLIVSDLSHHPLCQGRGTTPFPAQNCLPSGARHPTYSNLIT
jgi:hypothetical protein